MPRTSKAKPFDPERFLGKPAKIGWSTIKHKIEAGRPIVSFPLQFSFKDKNGNWIVTANGSARCQVLVWRPAYYRNDPRLVMVGGPEYNLVNEDRSTLQAIVGTSPNDFKLATDGIPYMDAFTKPLGLRPDITEWRYCYQIEWHPGGALGSMFGVLYGNQSSTYWSFSLRDA